MDSTKQLGKYLYRVRKSVDKALASSTLPDYSGERVRDIFDFGNPYREKFRTPKADTRVALSLTFSAAPPQPALDTCCSDCYCSVCEVFYGYENVDPSTGYAKFLLSYPYVPGTVYIGYRGSVEHSRTNIWSTPEEQAYSDPIGFIEETDPEAGIVTMGYYWAAEPGVYEVSGSPITICYIYKYPDCSEASGFTNYDGTVNIELQRNSLDDSSTKPQYMITWEGTGDSPPIGWTSYPSVGPVAYTETAGPYTGMKALDNFVADVDFNASTAFVGAHTMWIQVIRRRGDSDDVVASWEDTYSGGGYSGFDPNIHISGMQFYTGDVLYARSDYNYWGQNAGNFRISR